MLGCGEFIIALELHGWGDNGRHGGGDKVGDGKEGDDGEDDGGVVGGELLITDLDKRAR